MGKRGFTSPLSTVASGATQKAGEIGVTRCRAPHATGWRGGRALTFEESSFSFQNETAWGRQVLDLVNPSLSVSAVRRKNLRWKVRGLDTFESRRKGKGGPRNSLFPAKQCPCFAIANPRRWTSLLLRGHTAPRWGPLKVSCFPDAKNVPPGRRKAERIGEDVTMTTAFRSLRPMSESGWKFQSGTPP